MSGTSQLDSLTVTGQLTGGRCMGTRFPASWPLEIHFREHTALIRTSPWRLLIAEEAFPPVVEENPTPNVLSRPVDSAGAEAQTEGRGVGGAGDHHSLSLGPAETRRGGGAVNRVGLQLHTRSQSLNTSLHCFSLKGVGYFLSTMSRPSML